MSSTKFLGLGIMPALLLAACNEKPTAAGMGDSGSRNAAAANNAMAPAPPVSAISSQSSSDYLAQAGAGDLFETESSKAVLEKTQNPKIRNFAQMMIKAHQGSTAKLKDAAAQAKLTVRPPILMPDQQSMLDDINAASSDSVDAVYIASQKAAHQAALSLHQGFAATGDVIPLKQAAGEIVPVVRSHVEMLEKLGS
ncbi:MULTISPECIES: DUF4142 domain-containing protein [Sphingobium]|uniref:DUF4142 domain-containing protein n=1 Tax=Sphingobium TaxID=165695 RepID=UPI001BECD39C|nr:MULTISPECIES: DUF4142 domain-containing protein [Sphingobium]MBT2245024.1 DUF4142 domain-containing protein [Sphingobium sp. BHU LFT2]WBQ19386.1 DUF4142 domain-containing protein [Sphingobium yanoikuyae]